MNSTSNSPSREINKRLLMSIHQDGFFDILAGLILITFGFVPILDEAGLNPGVRQVILLSFYGISVFLVFWFKRKVTLPRTGFVQLSKKTTSRIALVMLMVNIGLFVLFVGVYILRLPLWDYLGSFQLSVPLGLIFLIMFSFSGGLLKAPRFYLYGFLALIAFMGFEYLFIKGVVAHHGIAWAGLFSGGVIFLSGCINLYVFIRRYRVE